MFDLPSQSYSYSINSIGHLIQIQLITYSTRTLNTFGRYFLQGPKFTHAFLPYCLIAQYSMKAINLDT